jgi:hypothetical protein
MFAMLESLLKYTWVAVIFLIGLVIVILADFGDKRQRGEPSQKKQRVLPQLDRVDIKSNDWAIDSLKFFTWIQLVLGIVIVALLIEGFSTLSTVPKAPEIKGVFDRYATFLIIIIAFQFGLSFVLLMAIVSMGGNLTAIRENTTQMVDLLTSIRSNTASNEKTTDT